MSWANSVGVMVKDRGGDVLLAYEQPSRSYVQQMIQMFRMRLRAATEANARETDNNLRTLDMVGSKLTLWALVGDADQGVVVGSGPTAVGISDFAMDTLITDGAGGGQLEYEALQAADMSVVAIVGGVASFTIPRLFTNASGGDVVVRETGMIAEIRVVGGALIGDFLIARDVLAAPLTVADSQTLTVTYTIGATA